MQNINTLEEQINYYKKEIQNLKEHYGEFELETNQEIKELQQRIDKAIEYMNDTIDFSWKDNSPIKNGKSLNLNKLLNILKGDKENG